VKPLVSILVPAFNAEKWIADSLESAVRQTWQPKEIIVVDDGSTDRTAAIAQEFGPRGVTLITQKNQGAAAARNTAFAASRGDYIQWLDADDLLAPDKIARQMEAVDTCRSTRTLLSSSWGRFLYRPAQAEFHPTALWCDLSPAEWLTRNMGQNLYMQTATWLVSRALTEQAGPWDAQFLQDDDREYFCRVLLASDGVRFVPDAKVFYRITGFTSLSYVGRSPAKLDARFRSVRAHIAYLRSLEDSPRTRAACVQYLQRWFIYYYPERIEIVAQAEQLAAELGGRLLVPQLSWKYCWIQHLFGWALAKRLQSWAPGVRWSLARAWDKTLLHLENASRGAVTARP
jgi:glycosyltransferase involved in cell wall biosynthesis